MSSRYVTPSTRCDVSSSAFDITRLRYVTPSTRCDVSSSAFDITASRCHQAVNTMRRFVYKERNCVLTICHSVNTIRYFVSSLSRCQASGSSYREDKTPNSSDETSCQTSISGSLDRLVTRLTSRILLRRHSVSELEKCFLSVLWHISRREISFA